VGSKVKAEGLSLFKVIGCHTDSPCFKIAPITKLENRLGWNQITVQSYGGGLWTTWFDRDLTLAGKIIVSEGGKLVSKYWHHKDPILSIPNLCIHFTEKPGEFAPNKESHIKPIIATQVIDQLFGEQLPPAGEDKYQMEAKHQRTLLHKVAKDLSVDPYSIVDFELNLIDAQ